MVPEWFLIKVAVYNIFIFLPSSMTVNKQIGGTGVWPVSATVHVANVHPALMHVNYI